MRFRAVIMGMLTTVLVACSDEPEPYYPPPLDEAPTVAAYDPALEPSAAVLPLVPREARQLRVTDFDQLRLTLGFGSLDGSSPQEQRDAFWQRFPQTAALTDGLLRPQEGRLRREFAVAQDDVAWEAAYSDGAEGWVLAFHEDVPSDRIRRAVRAGVGPLDGAVLDAEHNLVTSTEAPAPDASWGSDPGAVAVAGREASASLVQRGCVPLEQVYGDGIADRLEGQAADDVATLSELEHFGVHLGTELVTVRLGVGRGDAFTRLRLASHLPQLDPEFGRVFDSGVASPENGELGFRIARPAVAADWARDLQLPFAACRP